MSLKDYKNHIRKWEEGRLKADIVLQTGSEKGREVVVVAEALMIRIEGQHTEHTT